LRYILISVYCSFQLWQNTNLPTDFRSFIYWFF